MGENHLNGQAVKNNANTEVKLSLRGAALVPISSHDTSPQVDGHLEEIVYNSLRYAYRGCETITSEDASGIGNLYATPTRVTVRIGLKDLIYVPEEP